VGARFRSLVKHWVAHTYGLQWLMQHAQLFGIPTRIAKYPAGDVATFNAVCSMMRNLGVAGWGVFPQGTDIEFNSDSRAASTLPQVVLKEMADRECDILLLGQSLTTDTGKNGGGSYALGSVHEGVERDLLQRACNAVASVLTHQFTPAVLVLNYGDADESPEFCAIIPEPLDEKAMIERDTALLKIKGVAVAKSWFYDRHNVPMPEEGDEVLEGVTEEGAPEKDGKDPKDPKDGKDPDDTEEAKAAAVPEPFEEADYTAALAQFMEVLLLKAATEGAQRADEQFGTKAGQ
jgi:phage gp29-like protein